MANPLSILSDLAAGLSTIGASGAQGALSGQIEGEGLKREFASKDALNQLRALEMLLGQQRLQAGQQPTYQFHGDRMFTIPPVGRPGPPTSTELPTTSMEKARIDSLMQSLGLKQQQVEVSQARLDAAQEAAREKQDAADRRVKQAESGTNDVQREIARREKELGRALTIPERITAMRDVSSATLHPATQHASHFTTDAQGNVTEIKPDGTKVLHGKIGKPERPLAGLAPRETVTTSTKITPRKEITNTDELAKINSDLTAVVNEIAGNPKIQGWMSPGSTVRIEGYNLPVRREDVIARAMMRKHNAGVTVRWDGRNWQLVRAWIPEQREPMEMRRTTGPPRGQADEPEEQ